MELATILLIGIGISVCTDQADAAAPCCPENEKLIIGKCDGGQRITLNCTHGHMLLRDIILNGNKLSTQDSPGFVFVEDPEFYCLGEMYRNATIPSLGVMPVAVVCFEQIGSTNSEIETGGILTLISVAFLVLTFVVYMCLQQLRDLQGLCYMCMCVSMSLGFLSLGVLQLSRGFKAEICAITGFLVYFWMMATFFWMNVISVNMYRTVQNPAQKLYLDSKVAEFYIVLPVSGTTALPIPAAITSVFVTVVFRFGGYGSRDASYLRKTEKKQFFLYNCYAWGGSIFFLIVALSANYAEGTHYKPGIGDGYCWFSGRTETWIFFYGPIAVLIASNVLLFLLSSFNLWTHTKKYEVNKLNNLKHRFLVSLKLFLVMGISWIFEIASFAHGEAHIIWKIMDVFNCLQGVVIFLILVVFRRRAIRGLADMDFCSKITRPLAEKLSPDDDEDDQQILSDDIMEVRLDSRR